jgi:hypothetical protein
MDFIQTLHSLEEAVYEIVTWVLFLPKTFVKVFFRPDWIQAYVTAEFDKEPAERFQAYLSPILFWLIVAVVPYATTAPTDVNTLNLHANVPSTAILLSETLALMTILAWFSFILLMLKKLPIEPLASQFPARCSAL